MDPGSGSAGGSAARVEADGREAPGDAVSGRDPPRLHLVTDDGVLADPDFLARARATLAVGGGRLALHLRGRGTPSRRLHALSHELRREAREVGSLLLVNDRVDVCLAADLAGVQVPEHGLPVAATRSLLGPGAWIGASVHGLDAAVRARDGGADFLVVGTVFATSSHPEREPAGAEILQEVAAGVDAPLVAIGGVTPERVAVALGAGARGVAVLSGVWGANDPGDAVRRYLEALDAGRAGQPR